MYIQERVRVTSLQLKEWQKSTSPNLKRHNAKYILIGLNNIEILEILCNDTKAGNFYK